MNLNLNTAAAGDFSTFNVNWFMTPAGNMTVLGSIAAAGLVNLTGSACAYQFQDVSGGYVWQLYATAGMARLWHSGTGAGDKLTLDGSGNLSAIGSIAAAGGTITGALTLSPPLGWATLGMRATTGNRNVIQAYTGALQRWEIDLGDGTTESGSNAGSNFGIARFTDAGAYIDFPLMIVRSTGNVALSQNLFLGGNFVWFAGQYSNGPYVYSDTGNMAFRLGTGNGGWIFQTNDGTQQFTMVANGNFVQKGVYHYFLGSSSGTVNSTGGPFIYADGNMVAHFGGTGTSFFSVQDHTGAHRFQVYENGILYSNGAQIISGNAVNTGYTILYDNSNNADIFLGGTNDSAKLLP